MPRAAIDLGSNSILLLVLGDGGEPLHDEARVVGLGRGLGQRGLLARDRIEAALEVLRDYAERAEALGVPRHEIRAAGTSALRRAHNAHALLDAARGLGIEIEVIPAEREAWLTALGALDGLDLPLGTVLLADPGGGSTELVEVQRDGAGHLPFLLSQRSLELGVLRAGPLDSREALSRFRERVQELLGDSPPWPRALVATGGSATSLAAAYLGLERWQPGAVHGMVLDLGALRSWVERFLAAGPEGRAALLPASPGRAETILAGTVILEEILRWSRRPSMVVSERGLRYGLLLEPSR